MSHASRSGEESPKPTSYKVDTGPIPLDTLAVSPDGTGECWYRIPSWRVHFDHEALKGVDMRLHRAIGSHGVWTLTEASTGLKVFADLPHEFYVGDEGAMLAEFAAGRMLQLTQEKIADALAKGREKLRQHTPNPFNAVASETPAHEGYPGIAHDLETMRVAAGTAMRNIESLMCGYPDRFPQHAFEGTRDLLRDALAEIERKPQ